MKLLPELVSQFTPRRDVFIKDSNFCKINQYMKPYNNGTLVYTINFVTSYTYQKAHFCFSTYYIDTFLSLTSLFFPISKTTESTETNNKENERKVNQS